MLTRYKLFALTLISMLVLAAAAACTDGDEENPGGDRGSRGSDCGSCGGDCGPCGGDCGPRNGDCGS